MSFWWGQKGSNLQWVVDPSGLQSERRSSAAVPPLKESQVFHEQWNSSLARPRFSRDTMLEILKFPLLNQRTRQKLYRTHKCLGICRDYITTFGVAGEIRTLTFSLEGWHAKTVETLLRHGGGRRIRYLRIYPKCALMGACSLAWPLKLKKTNTAIV